MKAIDRLKSKYAVADSGCWEWIAHVDKAGYGTFWMQGRNYPAHRAAYILLRSPISDGLQIDHLCRNRRCVNPAHLEPVTIRENVLRGAGVAPTNKAKTHCSKGHPFSDDNTILRDGKRECRTCKNAHKADWHRRNPEKVAAYRIARQDGFNAYRRAMRAAQKAGIEYHGTTKL